jgi:SAM-dependent methyltransferase
MRQIMNRDVDDVLRTLPPEDFDAVEVSGRLRGELPWKSYTALEYPAFDLCAGTPSQSFDLVICEQVLEHVPDLFTAVKNLFALCRPGGLLLVSTPFLLRIHGTPDDFWRFTPNGLKQLLEQGGFDVKWVRSWGNRSCVRRNLRRWLPYQSWRSLRNDSETPMVVWALASRGEPA